MPEEKRCQWCGHLMSDHTLRSRIPGRKPQCFIRLSPSTKAIYDDRDEELAMARARLTDAEKLLRRWVDGPATERMALRQETEAWL